MRIELSATPNWLKISWPLYDAQIEAEILRRLNTVPCALGNGHRWYAPVEQLWLLTQLFDKASYQYEAMCAADAPSKPQRPTEPVQGPLTSEDAGWDLVMRGARNAAAKEEAEQFKYPKRRRRKAKKETQR